MFLFPPQTVFRTMPVEAIESVTEFTSNLSPALRGSGLTVTCGGQGLFAMGNFSPLGFQLEVMFRSWVTQWISAVSKLRLTVGGRALSQMQGILLMSTLLNVDCQRARCFCSKWRPASWSWCICPLYTANSYLKLLFVHPSDYDFVKPLEIGPFRSSRHSTLSRWLLVRRITRALVESKGNLGDTHFDGRIIWDVTEIIFYQQFC